MSRKILAALAASFVIACGCAQPPQPTHGGTHRSYDEASAEAELRQAEARGDADALLQLGAHARGLRAGARAADAGFELMATRAEAAATRCDDDKTEVALSGLAPYTLDDVGLDARFDELKRRVDSHRARCRLIAVDRAVEQDEQAWDWPAAFERIDAATGVSEADRRARRAAARERWIAFVDRTLASIVERRSASAVLGERVEAWRRSMDAARYPADLALALRERSRRIAAVELVFVVLGSPEVLDPPVSYVTFGAQNVRAVAAPNAPGRALPDGIAFHAVARGRLGEADVLVAGDSTGDLQARLESIRYLIPAQNARASD